MICYHQYKSLHSILNPKILPESQKKHDFLAFLIGSPLIFHLELAQELFSSRILFVCFMLSFDGPSRKK